MMASPARESIAFGQVASLEAGGLPCREKSCAGADARSPLRHDAFASAPHDRVAGAQRTEHAAEPVGVVGRAAEPFASAISSAPSGSGSPRSPRSLESRSSTSSVRVGRSGPRREAAPDGAPKEPEGPGAPFRKKGRPKRGGGCAGSDAVQ